MGELLHKRRYNSKTSYNEQDGTFTLSSHVGHIHYKENGNFVDSDISFVDMGTYWEMTKHNYHLQVAKDFSASLLMRYENVYERANHTITYEPKMLAWVNATDLSDMQVFRNQQAVQGVINGNIIRYTDAFGDGIHFEITLMRSGFKKEIVIDALNKLENPPTVNHKLVALFEYGGTGLKVLKGQEEWDKDGYLEGTEGFELPEEVNGLAKSFIRPAYIVDSEGIVGKRQNIKVFWKKHNNKLWQAKVLPRQFLLNATYPVRADTVTTYYAGSGDGRIGSDDGGSWSGCRTDVTPNIMSTSETTLQVGSYSNPFILRTCMPFDTSGLGAGATVSGVNLHFFADGSQNLGSTDQVVIQLHTRASNTALQTSDYATTAFTTELCDRVARNTINMSTNHNEEILAFNATGISNVSLTGFTNIGMRMGDDVDNDGPANNAFVFHSSEATGTSDDPKLVITYTAGANTVPSMATLGVGA